MTVQTLARGGHVLIPSNPCGIIFDLIETAFYSKEKFNGNIKPLFPHDSMASIDSRSSVSNPNSMIGLNEHTTNNTSLISHSVTNNTTVVTTSTTNNGSTNINGCNTTNVFGSGNNFMDGSSLAGRVLRSPIILLSNQIRVSLAYINAYGEWLNSEKESMLYTADEPFSFQAVSYILCARKFINLNRFVNKFYDRDFFCNYNFQVTISKRFF